MELRQLIRDEFHTGCPIHIVCTPKEEYLAVITAYIQTGINGPRISERGSSHEMYVLSGPWMSNQASWRAWREVTPWQ